MQKITLTAIEQSTCKDIVYLTFDMEQPLIFQEWQFVMLETINFFNVDKLIKRAYSIANTVWFSNEKKQICFYIKKVSAHGMSYYLTQKIKVWDQLTMSDAYGHMTNPKKYSKYLFVSIGSGVAPLYAIYKDLIQTGDYDKIVNIFGERYYKYHLQRFQHAFSIQDSKVHNMLYVSRESDLEIVKTATNNKNSSQNLIPKSKFLHGHVQEWITEAIKFLGDKDIQIFICWTPKMVKGLKETFFELGISAEQIRSEAY